jgi:hypothetical protein
VPQYNYLVVIYWYPARIQWITDLKFNAFKHRIKIYYNGLNPIAQKIIIDKKKKKKKK